MRTVFQAVLAAVRVQEGGLLQRLLPEARLEKAQDELPSNGGSGNLQKRLSYNACNFASECAMLIILCAFLMTSSL